MVFGTIFVIKDAIAIFGEFCMNEFYQIGVAASILSLRVLTKIRNANEISKSKLTTVNSNSIEFDLSRFLCLNEDKLVSRQFVFKKITQKRTNMCFSVEL
jgi:hypothetical protein